MRKLLITPLMALAVALVPLSAAADKPETRAVIPLQFEVGPVMNPCTNEETRLLITVEFTLHALPSVDSFFEGNFKHANTDVTGQVVGLDDGYATAWRHFESQVINQNDGHFVQAESENLMFYGEDGGKYKVRIRSKLVLVDGEVKVSSVLDEAFCVRQPAD